MRKLFRFGVVGAVNTLFSFGLYLFLIWMGLHFALANFLATVAGVLFSFRTHGRFVFGDTRWKNLIRFVPAWALIYGLNVWMIDLLVSRGLNAYEAGAACLLPMVIVSFLVQKYFVFNGPQPRSPREVP